MKLNVLTAIASITLATGAWANDSACGTTTHGSQLKAKAAQINLTVPKTIGPVLGTPNITATQDGAKVSAWFDIQHTKTGIPGNQARTDCGVLIAVLEDGSTSKAIMKSLQANEIDLVLAGKLPKL
jgi:hypothetical protein